MVKKKNKEVMGLRKQARVLPAGHFHRHDRSLACQGQGQGQASYYKPRKTENKSHNFPSSRNQKQREIQISSLP